MLCCVVLHYVTLRYAMLCYVMLCYVMLCFCLGPSLQKRMVHPSRSAMHVLQQWENWVPHRCDVAGRRPPRNRTKVSVFLLSTEVNWRTWNLHGWLRFGVSNLISYGFLKCTQYSWQTSCTAAKTKWLAQESSEGKIPLELTVASWLAMLGWVTSFGVPRIFFHFLHS